MKRWLSWLIVFCLVLNTLTVTSLPTYAASEESGPGSTESSDATLLSAASSRTGNKVILTFDKDMADPANKHDQFIVSIDGQAVVPTAATLVSGDDKQIDLSLAETITHGQVITVSYTAGDLSSSDTIPLASFADQPVINTVPRFFTISFDTQGGNDLDSLLIEEGSSLVSKPVVSRDGYNLNGWFDSPSDGTAVTFPYTPTDDLTLYAQWTKLPETNALLASLSIGDVDLLPAFDISVTSYSAIVSYETSSLIVSPVAASSLAALQVNGSELVGDSCSIDLSPGSNTINVIVTAEDGITSTVYTLTITRLASGPLLQSAGTDPAGIKIALAFDREMIDPAGKHDQFSISIDGVSVAPAAIALADDDASQMVLLLAGPVTDEQVITVSYTAGDLTAVDGSPLASFTDFKVANTVQPRPFIIIFDAQEGSPVPPQAITADSPLVIPPVTSRDGFDFSGWFDAPTGGTPIVFPYVPAGDITLYAQWTEMLSEDEKLAADLEALTWETIRGTNPSADSVTDDLILPTTGVVHGSVMYWATDNAAVISPYQEIGYVTRPTYAQGDIDVTLTAILERDNAGTVIREFKEFKLTVLRMPTDTNVLLTNLWVSGATISPAFDSETFEYSASVDSETTSIILVPILANSRATLQINDSELLEPSCTVALNPGINTILITVTAEDGFTQANYLLVVTREPASHVVTDPSACWHVEQLRSYHLPWVTLKSNLTGDAYLRLLDAEQQVVAISSVVKLIERSDFYAALYGPPGLLPGEYTAEVVCVSDQGIETVTDFWLDGHEPKLTVTDATVILDIEQWTVNDRPSIPGDHELYVRVTAFGVNDPGDLQIKLWSKDGEGNDQLVAQSIAAAWFGRMDVGANQFLYRLQMESGFLMESETIYGVTATRIDDQPLISRSHNWAVIYNQPIVYKTTVVDGSVGLIQLNLLNVPSGEYELGITALDSDWIERYTLSQTVNYNGSGTLDLQILDGDSPVYLYGNYRLSLKQDGDEVWSYSPHLSVFYDQVTFGERYLSAALLSAAPLALPTEQVVTFSAQVANITPEPMTVELVEVDQRGRVLRSVSSEPVVLNALPAYAPNGYIFANLYTVAGQVPMPVIEQGKDYRWRINCLSNTGEVRQLISATPLQLAAGPSVGQIMIEGAMTDMQHQTPFEPPSTVYYIGCETTNLFVLLLDARGFGDLSQVGIELRTANGSVVGNLNPDWISEASPGLLRGRVDLTGNLSAGSYQVVVSYAGQELARAPITALDQPMVGDLSLNTYNNLLPLPAGRSFAITLYHPFNLEPSRLQIALWSASTGDQIGVQVSPEHVGHSLTLHCEATQSLSGVYHAAVLYDGQPLMLYNPWGSEPLAPVAVSFLPSAHVTAAMEGEEEAYHLVGVGFTPSKTYQAMLYRTDNPMVQVGPLPLAMVNSSCLELLASQIDTNHKGRWMVRVLEDGRSLPNSQELHIILQPSEQPVIQPIVTLNNGATFTISREVQVQVSPGTFTEMRFADSSDELAALPYGPVKSSFTYTLSEGFGRKNLYLQFRDQAARETEIMLVSIDYLSSQLPDPVGFGVSTGSISIGKPLTIWAKSTVPVQATCEFLDADGNPIEPLSLSLARTSTDYGVGTYSRSLYVDERYEEVRSVQLTLEDLVTKAKWSQTIPLVFEPTIFIGQTHTKYDQIYYSMAYFRQSTPLQFQVIGTPGMVAQVVLTYRQVGAEAGDTTVTLPLSETVDAQGVYIGEAVLPVDAAFVSHVTYQLASSQSEQALSYEQPINKTVAASVQFTGLPNSTGAFDNSLLTVARASGWGVHQMKVTGMEPHHFSALEPGVYSYSLYDGQRTYVSDEIVLSAGATTEVDLSETPMPASLRIVAPDQARGHVYYTITDSSDNTWYQYGDLGETLTGLMVGDRVSYDIQLIDPSNQRYYQPDPQSLTIGQPQEVAHLTLETITKVTLSGRVVDQAFAAYGKTQPVAGVVVYLSQGLQNGSTLVYNNQSVTTDPDGRFSLAVFPGLAGELYLSKENYEKIRQPVTAATTDFSLERDLELKYLETGYISMELEVAAPDLPGEDHVYLQSEGAVWIASVAGPSGQPISGWYQPYNKSFFFSSDHDLKVGDQVTVRLQTDSTQGLKLNQAEYTLELDPHCSAHLVAQAIAPGEIHLAAVNEAGDPIHMLLFGQGRKLKQYSGNSLFSTRDDRLSPGEYTVVLFSGENLSRLHRLTSLDALQMLELTEGIHYVQRVVTVEQGRISDLGTITVPTVTNEQLGYLSDQGTSLSLTAGALIEPGKARGAVTVRYALPERLLELGYSIYYVQVRLNPGVIVDREYYLNGNKYWSPFVDTVVTPINLEEKTRGTVYFQLELEGESQLLITATATIQSPNQQSWIEETIFDGQLDLPVLTLLAPEEIARDATDAVPLRGVACSGSKVSLYDGGVLIGETVADARGRWQATVLLPNAGRLGAHQLTATMDFDGQTFEATAITRVAHNLISEARVWQLGAFAMDLGMIDEIVSQSAVINPSKPVLARFKLNTNPDELDYVGLANDYRGNVTIFPAQYQTDGEHAGYWLVTDAYLNPPGALSIVYSLKVQSDPLAEARAMAELTKTQMIDITNLPDHPQVDLNTLPLFMRDAYLNAAAPSDLIIDDSSYRDGSDGGSISSKLDLGGGRMIEFTGTQQALSDSTLDKNGLIRIETEQGYYWTSAPSVEIDEMAGTVRVVKRAYFSQALWDALNPTEQRIKQSAYRLASMQAQSTQDTLQAVEYTSTVTGIAGDLYELKKGANSLGKVGTGLNVLGGISLAGNALLGSMGLDPAELRASANLITESDLLPERDRLLRDIDEYQAATRKSHYINTLIGGVSYGSSFFGPLGKGLSYITNAGGMAYSSAIGSEYDAWGNAILSMIRSALAKQERIRLLAKKKKLIEPNWKIDPSGYVFEATEEERIPGITATVLLKDGGSFRVWSEAEEWDEINPQQTDSLGKYGWDVPEGEWKVRFEGQGYQTYETKSMEVPPLHDQVNIGLLSTSAPTVTALTIYPDAVEVVFSRYMLPQSLDGNVMITDSNGRPIPVKEIVSLDPVQNSGYTGTGTYSDIMIAADQFAKSFRIVPDTVIGGFAQYLDDGTTLATYTVRLHQSIASYSSVPMATDYLQTLPVSEWLSIPLTVRANSQSKVYGDEDPLLTYEIVAGNLLDGDALTGQLQRSPGEDVGIYEIQQGSLSGGDKYQITYEPGELTIHKRPLTVTADVKTKYVETADPVLTYHISSGSLVGGDMLSGQLSRQAGESVGSYSILQGGLTAGSNYQLTFISAQLTIQSRPYNPPTDPGPSDPVSPPVTPPVTPPTQPSTPVVTVTPEGRATLPLQATPITSEDGSVLVIEYIATDTLVDQIASGREQGATVIELVLDGDDQASDTMRRMLTIPVPALEAVAEDETLSLSISSSAATLTLPPTLLSALAAQGQPLSLTMHRTDPVPVEQMPMGAAVMEQPISIETSIIGQVMVEVSLNLDLSADDAERASFLNSLAIFAVHSGGELELIHQLQLTIDESTSPARLTSVSFPVDRFSSFTLIQFAYGQLTTTVGVRGFTIGGMTTDLPACYYDQGDTMMPMRMLESYGVLFAWDDATQTITASYRNKLIKLVIGSTTAVIDGEERPIIGASGRSIAPVIVEGRTMIPLRFVSEQLGFKVHWEPTHEITIQQ